MAVTLTACATRIPAREVPPLTVSFPVTVDSARALLLAAMRQERVPADGNDTASRAVTSSYTVRRGGIGESAIRLRFVLEPDNGGHALLFVEAVATDRTRSALLGGDRKTPVARAGSRAVPAGDLEALRPVQRLLRRLEAAGGLVARSP